MTRWGVVADDFTGACDLAGQVVAAGSTAVVVTTPEALTTAPPAAWTVLALKTRTTSPALAREASARAARALLDHGADLVYQKYCSTFDSTAAGNIGPVADALLTATRAVASVGTPASPSIDRTVYRGHLFVGDRLLSESPLRDHPLTPMRDPDLVRVLSAQTTTPVRAVPRETSTAELAELVRGTRQHLLLDAVCDADLDAAARALLDLHHDGVRLLVGGGAGLAAALARVDRAPGTADPYPTALATVPPGAELVLAGSCSRRTRDQIATFTGPVHRLDAEEILTDPEGAHARALAFVAHAGARAAVVSSADPAAVAALQARRGRDRVAGAAEAALARIAVAATGAGVSRLLVAGGETSGAVVTALGCDTLVIGPQISPGLPWAVAPATPGRPALALLLKSGNFGAAELFTTAWEAL